MKCQFPILLFIGLVIVLFPVFVQPKVISHPRRCFTNVKLNATMMLIYQTDWDDRFPLRDSWQDAVRTYSKDDRYDRCPALQLEKPNPQVFGLAFSKDLAAQRTPMNPQSFPLVFDSINLARNASGTIDSLPKPGRHNSMNNIAYADGSAKQVRAP